MTDKDKRQLRAEAVGDPVALMRLENDDSMPFTHLRQALGLDRYVGSTECLRVLADMVERDYVRRDSIGGDTSDDYHSFMRVGYIADLIVDRDSWKAEAKWWREKNDESFDALVNIYRMFYNREEYDVPNDPRDMIVSAVEKLQRERDEAVEKLETLLCQLTNGKFSKASYSVDFMESAVRDEIERDYVPREEYDAAMEWEACYERMRYERDEQEDRAKRAEADAKTQRNNFEMVSRNSEWYKSQIFELGESFGCREPGVKGTLERIYGEWDKLKAERDEWHDAYDSWCLQMERLEAERDRQAAMVEDLSADYAAMVAERDEWKAKYEAATNGIPVGTNGITLDENGRQYADLGKLGNEADRESYADSGTAEAGTSQVPKCDTREKLEADVLALMNDFRNNANLKDPDGKWEGKARALLDRQADITERELGEKYAQMELIIPLEKAMEFTTDPPAYVKKHIADLQAQLEDYRNAYAIERDGMDRWRSRAGARLGEVNRLEAEMEAALKEIDELRHTCNGAELTVAELRGDLEEARSERDACADEADRFEREARKWKRAAESLSVVGKDGREIKAGQSVYGLSDGRKWFVAMVDRSKPKYPVNAIAYDGAEVRVRQLKPEWLTHEPPDSFERIIADASMATDFGGNIGMKAFKELVERCERIGGAR